MNVPNNIAYCAEACIIEPVASMFVVGESEPAFSDGPHVAEEITFVVEAVDSSALDQIMEITETPISGICPVVVPETDLHVAVQQMRCSKDLLDRLVCKSPTAEIEIAGISVGCVLDTGAETSLLPSSFYREHLSTMGIESLGRFVKIVGVNDLEVPVDGYLDVPIKIFGKTMMASFFVKPDSVTGTVGRRPEHPVILGCNVLRAIADAAMEPVGPSREDWKLALRWMHLASSEQEVAVNCCAASVEVADGGMTAEALVVDAITSELITIHPGEVRVINCRLAQTGLIAEGCIVSLEADQEIIGPMCVIEGIQVILNGALEVIVANPGPESLTIPATTKLLAARAVSESEEVIVSPTPETLTVSIQSVLVEQGEAASPFRGPMEAEKQAGEPLSAPTVFCFPDNSLYTLPPGVTLDGLSQSDAVGMATLIRRYDSVFSKGPLDVGCCGLIPHEINVIDSTPVNTAYRRVPPHLVDEVKCLLQGLLEKGLIRRSCSNYASAVVLVRKKSGALRLCIDYRQLNAKCLKDAFPLPRIEESLDAMSGACLFSSLDLAHGYFQVTMHPDSVSKTAFRVPWGLYEFVRMPQGLMNSPSTFQRIMELIFGDLNLSELILYLDDVLVFSQTASEQVERLEKVFHRLQAHGLKLNGGKCQLFQTQVAYLGHVVSKEGVAVDPDKIARIRDWPVPTTVAELRSFLGLASYYRRYVDNFSTLAGPLHALAGNTDSKKGKNMRLAEWSDEANQAFLSLKQALCGTPILRYPRFDRPFVVEVDASLKGLGACLSQEDDEGNLRPIAFASRGLRGAERNYTDYSSFKLELLALKWAVSEKFKAYTIGSHCIVYTDHNPLAHLKTANLGATEHRWVAQLASFDIEVRYRTGKSNRCADALSRCPANMSVDETATVLHLAMKCTAVPNEIGGTESLEVSLAEITVSEGGLPPAVLPSYSPEQLAKMQADDPVLGRLRERWSARWVPGQPVPNDDVPGLQAWVNEWPNLSERDGVLYRVSRDMVHGHTYQLLVPEVLRTVLLRAVHDQWGHQGVGRSYGLLKSRGYWPGMNRHVREHVRKCFQCTVTKAQTPVVRPPLCNLLAFKPLERLAIDFLKLDRGRGGYEDVLVMTDSFTKFAQAVPCHDQTAPTVAKVLRDHWFMRYGVPLQLHSDQGRNFESDLIRETCELYGVRKTRTSPYHPQGNGQTERFNHTLCSLIKSLSQTERRKWPDALPHLVMIYNTTPHSVTGISPYTLMFGRKPVLPVDQLISNTRHDWNEDFIREQSDLVLQAHAVAKDCLMRAAEADKQRWDRRALAGPMKVGERVLLKQCAFTGRHKLSNIYAEPSHVVVSSRPEQNLYQVRPALGGPAKWVNRKMMVIDPRTPPVNLKSGLDTLPEEVVGVADDSSDESAPDAEVPSVVPVCRRSGRQNKGQHSNPLHLPVAPSV